MPHKEEPLESRIKQASICAAPESAGVASFTGCRVMHAMRPGRGITGRDLGGGGGGGVR